MLYFYIYFIYSKMGILFMVLHNCKKRKPVSIEKVKVVWGFYLCSLAALLRVLCYTKMCVCVHTQPVGAWSRSELPPLFLAPEMQSLLWMQTSSVDRAISWLWLPAWSLSLVLLSVLWLTAASSCFADPWQFYCPTGYRSILNSWGTVGGWRGDTHSKAGIQVWTKESHRTWLWFGGQHGFLQSHYTT